MPSNGSGYGTDYYGVGPWGIAPPTGTFSLEDIFAVSERSVRVTFTEAAYVQSAFKVGSALNLATWSISIVGSSDPLILIGVREVTGSGARQFELYTLNKFPSYFSTLNVQFPNVLSASETPIVGPSSGTCAAAKVPEITPRLNKIDYVDISNVPTGPTETLGVMQVAASGDYAEDVGDALLKKMVLRRITSLPGAFFHIPESEFGLGVRTKEPLLYSDMKAFKAELERQILLEPDASRVQATVLLGSDGVLTVKVRVRRQSTGREFDVSVDIPTQVTL